MSAESVNYAIRPNKAVERKLLFDLLATISPIYNFSGYRYIGLGALWFVDFVLAHKLLSISDMISIESDPILASRATFNKPYSCIDVVCGDSESVLPSLDLEELPLLVWLDYNASLDGSVLNDLAVLCRRAPSGSVLLVTLNAHRGRLPTHDENGKEYETFADKVRALAGDLVPPSLPREAAQTSGYPKYLASLVFQHMRRAVRRAGRSESLLPICNIGYSDSEAPMVTVGAVISDNQRTTEATELLEARGLADILDQNHHLKIGVPPLTLKEKATLDQLMPCNVAPTPDEVSALGFKLKPSQIDAYHRFYLYYPMFGEVSF